MYLEEFSWIETQKFKFRAKPSRDWINVYTSHQNLKICYYFFEMKGWNVLRIGELFLYMQSF